MEKLTFGVSSWQQATRLERAIRAQADADGVSIRVYSITTGGERPIPVIVECPKDWAGVARFVAAEEGAADMEQDEPEEVEYMTYDWRMGSGF